MLIQEAIKSGKPFKRRGEPVYYIVEDGVKLIRKTEHTYYDYARLGVEDILADDWEVKE